MTLDSLLSTPPYEGLSSSQYSPPTPPTQTPACLPPPPPPVPIKQPIISSHQQHWRPGHYPPGTPPGVRRRKYDDHGKVMVPRGFRQDVEQLCMNLMCHYQHCLSVIPPYRPPPHLAHDSLMMATKLLSDAVSRV